MKNYRLFIALGLTLGLARAASAAPCDASTNCELPAANGSAGSWTASASGMTGIQASNSVGPTGNVIGSRYFFAATTSNLGASPAKGSITTTGDGIEVIGSFALNSGSTPGSTVTGGVVQSLLGNSGYFFYAQACPSGQVLDSARCSNWAQIGNKNTLPYPSAVFSTPVRPTDADTNSINARASVPTADNGNISQLQFAINNLITPALNQTGILLGWVGSSVYTIDNSLYTNGGGFKPNVKYQFQGQVFYPYGVAVPTAGAETEGPFWTTPSNPGTVSVSNVTHCSAQVTALNSGGTANPSYTRYNLCATSDCEISSQIGGNPSVSMTISGLADGQSYTPNATALVGNQDGSESGWSNSGATNGSNFTTLAWAGSFSVTGITTSAATFNVLSLNTTGVVQWQMVLNGSLIGSATAGVPPATIPLSGLNPNTQYTVQIRLTEASGCFSDLPQTALAFTTTPNVPATFGLSASAPTVLSATWATNGNPGNTIYQVQYCLDAGFSSGCQNQNSAAGATSVNLTAVPATTYWAHVRALTVGGGLNSAFSNDASATTPPDIRAITINPPTANVFTGGTQLFTATVTNDVGAVIPGQAVNWTISGGGTRSPANGASTTFTAGSAPGGPFTMTASLAGWSDATASVTILPSGFVVTNGPSFTVNPDGITGNATVRSNYNNVPNDPATTHTWSLESGPSAASFSPNGTFAARDSAITFSKAGSYMLRVSMTNSGETIVAQTAAGVVPQILESIRVCPSANPNCAVGVPVTLQTLQSEQFAATGFDQFGDPMSLTGVNWDAVGCQGCISGGGQFSSGQIGVQVTIRATHTASGKQGAITVLLVSFDVSGARAYPVPFKRSMAKDTITFDGLGSQCTLHIYTASGRRVFDASLTTPTFDWNVVNNSGESLASGVYFYLIESPQGKKNGKLIIVQ